MLIVWISICTEVSDVVTLVYKNRSQILIVLLAGHLSLRDWGAAACSVEEDPVLWGAIIVFVYCMLDGQKPLFNFSITWNVFTEPPFCDVLHNSTVVLKALFQIILAYFEMCL